MCVLLALPSQVSSGSHSGPLKVEALLRALWAAKLNIKIFLLSIFPIGELDFS